MSSALWRSEACPHFLRARQHSSNADVQSGGLARSAARNAEYAIREEPDQGGIQSRSELGTAVEG